MSTDVRALSNALLYEGYLLYPYRATALKNHFRAPLGSLYPEWFCREYAAGDRSSLMLECVALGGASATVTILLRFLELGAQPVERDVPLAAVTLGELRAGRETEFGSARLRGAAVARAREERSGIWIITVEVFNRSAAVARGETASRQDIEPLALGSPHVLVTIAEGRFASLIDPPDEIRDEAAACQNVGTWPVLTGTPGAAATLLSAPIILSDYPQIAPESIGDFFDGTDIDELLTLRVLTLTDAEKREMAGDARARALLARTESRGENQLPSLHGAIRAFERKPLSPGRAVRLHPRGRADILDLVLAGKCATIQAVEYDLEGRTYVAVTIDDDPGKDLGVHGHRFFFRPDEIELL